MWMMIAMVIAIFIGKFSYCLLEFLEPYLPFSTAMVLFMKLMKKSKPAWRLDPNIPLETFEIQ